MPHKETLDNHLLVGAPGSPEAVTRPEFPDRIATPGPQEFVQLYSLIHCGNLATAVDCLQAIPLQELDCALPGGNGAGGLKCVSEKTINKSLCLF